MEHELKDLSEKLLGYQSSFLNKFERTRENGEDGNFYKDVKPFADEVKAVNDAWLELAQEWVFRVKPLYVGPQHIRNAHEQIEKLSIQVFYLKSSRKLFLDSNKSVEFILRGVLKELEHE